MPQLLKRLRKLISCWQNCNISTSRSVIMASRRPPLHQTPNPRFNFRSPPPSEKLEATRGTKPTAEPTSISETLLLILQHVCKKIVFVNTKHKILVYFGVVFLLSLIADFAPIPRTFFARKDNIFNLYFVKVAWGWTLLLSIPFVSLTSFTYCCGKRDKVLKHCSRLLIATVFWYVWVNLYNFIESVYGRCNVKDPKYQHRSACLAIGRNWSSIDISGHCFILIYSTLVLIEEARAINCWEGITDLIRDEGYARSVEDKSNRPLRSLSLEDLEALKTYYTKFSPYIRGLFIAITSLTILWDIMLLSTILYFHNMLEKLLAYGTAVGTWAITYQLWYRMPDFLPPMPGEGMFKYQDSRVQREVKIKQRPPLSARVPGPKFMGMPLRVPPEAKITPTPSEEQPNNVL